MTTQVATAYVSLTPEAGQFAQHLTRIVRDAVNRVGEPAGRELGSSIADEAGDSLRRDLPREVEAAARSAERAADQGGQRVGGGLASGLKSKLGGMSTMLKGAVLTAVGGSVGALVKSAVDAAGDAEQSIGGVEAVFKKHADSINEAAKESAQNVGLSANQYRELASVLGSSLKNKGITDYANQTKDLITLGADLSSMFGGTAAEAVDALTSALRGETDPIERYGVSLNAAAIEAEALASGLVKPNINAGALRIATMKAQMAQEAYTEAVKKHGKQSDEAKRRSIALETAQNGVSKAMKGSKTELTDQQKAMAALSLISKQTADAQGNFAKEADTYQGKQQRLKASFEDLKTTVGSKLLPVFTSLTDWANSKGIPALRSVGSFVSGTVAPAFAKLTDFVRNNSTAFQFAGSVLGGVVLVFGALKAAMLAQAAVTKVVAVAQGALNLVMAANPMTLVVVAIGALIGALFFLYKRNDLVRKALKSTGDWIKNTLAPIFSRVLGGAVKFVTDTVWPKLKTAFNNAKRWASPVIDWYKRYVIFMFKTALPAAINFVTGTVIPKLKTAFNNAQQWGSSMVDGLTKTWGKLRSAFSAPVKFVVNDVIRDKLVSSYNKVASKIKLPTIDFAGITDAGFHAGGWTGPGSKYQPAGIVHADEFVIRKEARQKFERDNPGALAHLNATGKLPGFADGGHVGGRGGGGGATWTRMAAWLRKNIPWARITSTFRPGSITASGNLSYHARGKALDMVGGGGHSMGELFNRLRNAWPGATELIHSPANGRQLKHGRNHMYGGKVRKMHFNHVHWAMNQFNPSGARWVNPNSPDMDWSSGGGGWNYSIPNPVAAGLHKAVNSSLGLATKLVDTMESRFGDNIGTKLAAQAGRHPINGLKSWLNEKIDSAFPALTEGFAKGGHVKPLKPTLYDTGGVLPPGLTLVSNQTGKPEYVHTFEDEQKHRRAQAGNGGPAVVINVKSEPTARELEDRLNFAMARQSNMRRYRR